MDSEDIVLYDLWHAYRGTGFAPGPLPEAGGMLDQAACVLASFGVMSAAAAVMEGRGQDGPETGD